jgi:Ca2+-dependent lipid-binding protein
MVHTVFPKPFLYSLAPFVIIELTNEEDVIFVKNTKQKSNKINPLFEESFDIPVSTDSKIPLDQFHLRITAFRYTFSGSNDMVGMVCLETGSSHQNEADHWKEVTMNPHTTIMKWHKLRIA